VVVSFKLETDESILVKKVRPQGQPPVCCASCDAFNGVRVLCYVCSAVISYPCMVVSFKLEPLESILVKKVRPYNSEAPASASYVLQNRLVW
jgi:hypothetical protein